MKHIKNFETIDAADGWVIDNPFVSGVQSGTLIYCNEPDKKLEVNDGQIEVVNNVNLITFKVRYVDYSGQYGYTSRDEYVEFTEHAVEGMKWSEFVDSIYNQQETFIDTDGDTVTKIYNKCMQGGWFDGQPHDYSIYFSELWPTDRQGWDIDFRYDSKQQLESGNDVVLENGKTYYYWYQGWCLFADTEITMADGTTKQIKDIVVGDEVLSLDLETSEHISRKVVYADPTGEHYFKGWDEWIFSDGTIIKTINRHEFYNVEAGKFKYMDEWKIGEHTYKLDGTTPELVEHIAHDEVANRYRITLEDSNNFFANGLLTGDRYCNNLDIHIL